MKHNYILGLIFFLSLLACEDKKAEKEHEEITKTISTDLQVDHLNIWVKNPTLIKERLNDLGFTSIPDSLSSIHKGQGTSGRYFYFLNAYLELIFVYNQAELEENNRINEQLDFTKRANFEKNGASPFGVALKVKDYNLEKIPFETVRYHQDWMNENLSIYSAKNSKIHSKEPSIFVVYPEIEADNFETLDDLKNIPEEYAFARAFYKHPNGAKKITNIKITSTDINLSSKTIQSLNEINNIRVKNGSEHLMELYFDENIQGKSFDLRPELPLKIYL